MPLVKTCSRKLSSASSATSSVIPSGDAAGRTALFPVPSSSLSQLLVWCPMVMREQPRVVAIDGKLEAQRQGGVPQPGRPPPRRCIRFEDHEPQVLEDTLQSPYGSHTSPSAGPRQTARGRSTRCGTRQSWCPKAAGSWSASSSRAMRAATKPSAA
eukprot:CAMPEP_0177440002 /NCGR_PEP_ID=MMETSP0369-20130122/3618_1 /TAXON_ID=447022 ORGANISM="Scrippsiella hangoei-like, Strain SHHI-4" /NCGR_SAMPLE_ID=MMETSP0369 /ASSEMBLY_ACC=CAM_ASM_000364 /LENGTH=155 /DNA_ID=CAMNT_0018911731 /DNA_START=119 /DNA_END=583 /DNA_ORIENTATION=-